MHDWSSPEELHLDAEILAKVTNVFFGLYVWDMFMTFSFDWSLMIGKTTFTWPMAFYLAHRYILLFGMIGILITLNTTIMLNCQALMVFNQFAGDAAVGLASINLSIRTISVWSNHRWVVIPIIFLILGHWALILQVVLLKAKWTPTNGCTIISTNNQILVAVFLYTILFDFIVLLLTGWRLCQMGVSGRESRLGRLMWEDGLVYFLVAVVSNVVIATFMLLNWNPIMNIMFTIPGTVFSSIAACRAVRRLRRSTEHEIIDTLSQIHVSMSRSSTSTPPPTTSDERSSSPSTTGTTAVNNCQWPTPTQAGGDSTPRPSGSSMSSDYYYDHDSWDTPLPVPLPLTVPKYCYDSEGKKA